MRFVAASLSRADAEVARIINCTLAEGWPIAPLIAETGRAQRAVLRYDGVEEQVVDGVDGVRPAAVGAVRRIGSPQDADDTEMIRRRRRSSAIRADPSTDVGPDHRCRGGLPICTSVKMTQRA